MIVTIVGMAPTTLKYAGTHQHELWEIILNLQGEGYVLIGNRRFEYSPGTILICPPDTPHTKYSADGFRDIYLSPSVFPLGKHLLEKGRYVFQDDTEKSYETLMIMTHRAFHQRACNSGNLTDALFESMNQLMLGWLRGTSDDRDIERLKNRLIGSFTDPELTVSGLMEDSAYCGDHLRRKFKDATGQTLLEYLTQLRLDYAKKLMSEQAMLNCSIAEIGAMSGYYDSHYFSRIFKKHTGMTPAGFIQKVSGR